MSLHALVYTDYMITKLGARLIDILNGDPRLSIAAGGSETIVDRSRGIGIPIDINDASLDVICEDDIT